MRGSQTTLIAYLQHAPSGKWWEVYQGLTVDDSLEASRGEGVFQP